MTVVTLGIRPARRDALVRRIRLLAAFSIAYNVIEAVVAIAAGIGASSSALVGFGLDSVVEVSSAAALAWQFSARDHARRDSRERAALRVTALSFFAVGSFVAVDSIRSLAGTGEAQPSTVGIVLAGLSLAIMPAISLSQRSAGKELGSASAVADAKQTLLCSLLSAVLLVGLAANASLGWSWADPVAGLGIAALAIREGRSAWRGEGCCAPTRDRGGDDGCDCC